MAATMQQSPARGAGEQHATYSPPNPQAEAHRLLTEARGVMTVALDALRSGRDHQRASDLVGRASDRIGQALFHLRQFNRR